MREQPFHLEFEKQIKELKEALGEAWEINAELMAGLEVGAGKYKQLRELNAELLQDLIEVLPYAKSWAGWDDAVVRNAEKTITKAKQFNEPIT
jgi:hypothetical protein